MKAVFTLVAALALSLLIWVLFYVRGLELTAADTEVVVGVCLALVVTVRWAWKRVGWIRPKRGAGKPGKVASPVLIAFLVASAPGRAATIACSPERPLVSLDSAVTLRVWGGQEPGKTAQYTWTASAGTMQGQGPQVLWSLKGLSSGIFTAEVRVGEATEQGAVCSMQVVVAESERGPEVKRETGRSFLVKGAREAGGYGLYSYLLLGSPPSDAMRDRYLKILQAYLGIINDINDFGEYVTSREKLNITFLPIGAQAEDNATAAWLVEHYDYARARVYLDLLPGSRRDGIYLVSCSKPLSEGANPPYLLQDLSTIPVTPEDLASPWVREFLNQAAQDRFWEPRTMDNLILKLRTTIAVLAIGLPDVQNSLRKWIDSIH